MGSSTYDKGCGLECWSGIFQSLKASVYERRLCLLTLTDDDDQDDYEEENVNIFKYPPPSSAGGKHDDVMECCPIIVVRNANCKENCDDSLESHSVTWVHAHNHKEYCHYLEDTEQLVVKYDEERDTKGNSDVEYKNSNEDLLNQLKIYNNSPINKTNYGLVMNVDSLEEILDSPSMVSTVDDVEEEAEKRSEVILTTFPREIPSFPHVPSNNSYRSPLNNILDLLLSKQIPSIKEKEVSETTSHSASSNRVEKQEPSNTGINTSTINSTADTNILDKSKSNDVLVKSDKSISENTDEIDDVIIKISNCKGLCEQYSDNSDNTGEAGEKFQDKHDDTIRLPVNTFDVSYGIVCREYDDDNNNELSKLKIHDSPDELVDKQKDISSLLIECKPILKLRSSTYPSTSALLTESRLIDKLSDNVEFLYENNNDITNNNQKFRNEIIIPPIPNNNTWENFTSVFFN